jgi:dTDP-4-dehydrorhamnose reductase
VRILITGGSGYLGCELGRQAAGVGADVVATYLSRPGDVPGAHWQRLDLRVQTDVVAVIGAVRPDVIINAAYRYDDWATTADGAAAVAAAAARTGAHLVHVSSDAIFSGTAAPYAETAIPDPVMPYGAAKAAAETAVRALMPGATVARTSLITGDGRSAHELLVHDLALGRRQGVLFADDVRCPVHVADLASALLELAHARAAGVHHVGGADPVSRYELGCLIAGRDGLDGSALRSGSRRAARLAGPLDVRLDSRATQAGLRTRLRGAREFITGQAAEASRP